MNDITQLLIDWKTAGNVGLAKQKWTEQLTEIRALDEPPVPVLESLFESPELLDSVPTKERPKLWTLLLTVFGIFAVVIWRQWRKWIG